jgi:hypothetical protein
LFRPIWPDVRRIGIRRPGRSGAGASRPRAVLGWAAKGSGGVYLPHCALRVKERFRAATVTVFSLEFVLQNTVFVDFVQFFEQISNSFFIQIIPTKVCLENAKVIEIFLKSLKFMNFIHVSAANI